MAATPHSAADLLTIVATGNDGADHMTGWDDLGLLIIFAFFVAITWIFTRK